jgi:hypothetical protein
LPRLDQIKHVSAQPRTLSASPAVPPTNSLNSCGFSITSQATDRSPCYKQLILMFRTYSDYDATTNEWISILKLACEYEFVQVKNLAIRGLEGMNLSAVERLCIYQLYRVGPSHTVPLLVELCIRNEGPTDDETEKLGIKTSLVIYRARESLRSQLPADVDHRMAASTVCSLIGVDLSQLQLSGGSVMFHALHHLTRY